MNSPRLGLAPLVFLFAATLRGQLSWTTETVASPNPLVTFVMPAVALGANGTAGIAYVADDADASRGWVHYASRSSGGAWSVHEGIDDRGTGNFIGLSTRLTSAGDPRVAYFVAAGENDGRYASRTGGTWSVGHVTTTGATGEYIHLALASDGTPRVAYGTNSASLNYASGATGSWLTQNITSNGIPAFLRLNASNVPFVAFHDTQDSGDLRIASNPTGSSWSFVTAVSGFSGLSTTVSFRLHGSDGALSFVDNGALKLARSSGGLAGTWNVETIVGSEVTNAATSLVLDSNGNSYVAYQTAGGEVRVASSSGDSWVWDPLESTCRHASLSIL